MWGLTGEDRGGGPLGSEPDQFSESWVERWVGRWVDVAVGFTEHRFVVAIVFDLPSVFVEEPVVVATEEDQIVQIGRASIGPVLTVVGMNEMSSPTTGEATATIPEPELVT